MSNMYESGSLGDQFNPHQQGPKPLPKSAFDSANGNVSSSIGVTRKALNIPTN